MNFNDDNTCVYFITVFLTLLFTASLCPELNGWFPHPNDCHKFILCFHGKANVRACPANLSCDRPQKYPCSNPRCKWPLEFMLICNSFLQVHLYRSSRNNILWSLICREENRSINFGCWTFCIHPRGRGHIDNITFYTSIVQAGFYHSI